MTNIFAPAIENLAAIGLAASLAALFGCALWLTRSS